MSDPAVLTALVKRANIVVSLVPYQFHPKIARVCIAEVRVCACACVCDCVCVCVCVSVCMCCGWFAGYAMRVCVHRPPTW